MKKSPTATQPVDAGPLRMWLPWWYRPSRLLLGASLPALIIFTYSDSTLSLSKAQLFYGSRDFLVGLIALAAMFLGALLGESKWFSARVSGGRFASSRGFAPRIAEGLLTERVDRVLMAVFLVSHLVFFRNFFLDPGLISGVLGGNLELKHTFKTIPGVTTWTQVSLVLGALRGLRWAGVLPGRVKLISVFHLVFFGTLFVRAILWSERLAMIEGAVPFFLGALPRLATAAGPHLRLWIRLFPFVVPVMLLFVFTAFESLRSWQYYAGQHSSVLEFGWRRLFTYYFEAMNTGAATLGVTGFYDGLTLPMGLKTYDEYYKGLYMGALDVEYNNVSGLWYLATRAGSLLFIPVIFLHGCWHGLAWRAFSAGRLFGLFFPISFLGLMEIIRIPYWFGLTRVLPSTLVILIILAWAVTLRSRVRRTTATPEYARPGHPAMS